MYDNAMIYDIHSEERYHLYSIIIELTGRKVPRWLNVTRYNHMQKA
jgi:hypothetical protein